MLISSNELGKRAAQHQNVIAAATQSGVKRIVYTSVLHANTSTLSVATEHRETESFLRESGLAFTLLRNGWYTENHRGSLHGVVAAGALIGSAGSGRISGAARADYAEAAYAAALAQFGLPAVFAKAIAGWDVEASKGELFDEGRQLPILIGRPTTPLSVSVASALG